MDERINVDIKGFLQENTDNQRVTFFGEFIDELDRESLIRFASYVVKENKKLEQQVIGLSNVQMEEFFTSARVTF
jgi:hypothetical protein